jgi:hypothetical protein
MGADPGRHPGRAAAGQLLEEDGLVDRPGGGAAVLLLVLQAEQVKRAEALEEIAGELPFGLPLIDPGPDFFLNELADRSPKRFVLAAEEMRTRRAYRCQ